MPEIVLEGKAADAAKVAGVDEAWLERVAERAEHAETLRRVVGGSAALIAVLLVIVAVTLAEIKGERGKVARLEKDRDLMESKVNPSPEKISAMIQGLREMADPNLRDIAGRSRIFLACKAGRLDKAIAWHKLGGNWNTPRNAGVFTNGGRNFDRSGKFRMTHASPLMVAATHRHWHIVEYALDNLREEIEWDYRDLHGKGLIGVLERAFDAGETDPALLRCIEKFPNL